MFCPNIYTFLNQDQKFISVYYYSIIKLRNKYKRKKDNRHNFVLNNNNYTSYRNVCPPLFSLVGLINPVVLFVLNNYRK